MNERIRIKWDEEYACYDVEVKDTEATVADFEKVCEKIFSEEEARRRYGDTCIGCSLCCSERIPVTRIDMQRIYGSMLDEEGLKELDFREWLSQRLSVKRYGGCVDVTLRVNDIGICNFWLADKGICSVYGCRPLACRTYLCAPVSYRMEELRSRIINLGQDDLVAFLYEDVDEEYRRENAFNGAKNYGDIPLRKICTKRLWRQLTESPDDAG